MFKPAYGSFFTARIPVEDLIKNSPMKYWAVIRVFGFGG